MDYEKRVEKIVGQYIDREIPYSVCEQRLRELSLEEHGELPELRLPAEALQ